MVAHAGNVPDDLAVVEHKGIGVAGQADLTGDLDVAAILIVRFILGHVIFQLGMEDVLFGQRHHDECLPAALIGARHIAIAVAKQVVVVWLAQDIHGSSRLQARNRVSARPTVPGRDRHRHCHSTMPPQRGKGPIRRFQAWIDGGLEPIEFRRRACWVTALVIGLVSYGATFFASFRTSVAPNWRAIVRLQSIPGVTTFDCHVVTREQHG